MSLPWTERYRPSTLQEVAGNYTATEQLLDWVKGRIEGSTAKRAALLVGPPGTGKSVTVALVAKALDLDLIEMNASDFRTEELVERVAGGASLQGSLFGQKGRLIFLDELDGISGREDRGGLGAILRIIKETRHPVVMAVNDPWDPKFRSLREACEIIQFRRIRTPSIEVQLRRIAKLNGVSVDEALLARLAERAGGDLRAAINDFQMLAEGRKTLKDEEVGMLFSRVQERGIFDVMKSIFSAEGCLEAKLAAEGASVDPEMLLQWINENIGAQYPNPAERAFAFEWLSRADLFLNRAKRRQMWELLGYAIELATGGAALARKGPYRYTRYNFPRRIGMLSVTKESRGTKKETLGKLAVGLHASRKKVAMEYLPYMELLASASAIDQSLFMADSRET